MPEKPGTQSALGAVEPVVKPVSRTAMHRRAEAGESLLPGLARDYGGNENPERLHRDDKTFEQSTKQHAAGMAAPAAQMTVAAEDAVPSYVALVSSRLGVTEQITVTDQRAHMFAVRARQELEIFPESLEIVFVLVETQEFHILSPYKSRRGNMLGDNSDQARGY